MREGFKNPEMYDSHRVDRLYCSKTRLFHHVNDNNPDKCPGCGAKIKFDK